MAGVDPSDRLRLDAAVHRVLDVAVEPASRAELARVRDVIASRELVAEGLLLLSRIVARCTIDDDPVSLGTSLALRHELANLALLRGNRDSLIGE